MRRLSLSTLLLGLNAALVLLAVVAMAAAAARLLGRFADEQGQRRVSLAGAAALQAVARSEGDVRTSAHLLSERATLVRLLGNGDAAGLASFLERFRATSHLSGCAVFSHLQVKAASGAALPWGEVLAHAGGPLGREGGGLLRRPGAPLLLAAAAPVAASPGAIVVTALALDPAYTAEVSGQIGLPVEVVDIGVALARERDPAQPLYEQALDSGRPVSARVPGAGRYVAALPLRAPSGRVAALVTTLLPMSAIGAELRPVVRGLLLLALVVALLATLSGLAVGRHLARPVQALTRAAARIGRGDLETPMPQVQGGAGLEVGTLAATMEEMRRRLLGLTAELRRRQAEAETILTGIAVGVFEVDRDRRVRYLNPQAAALLGVKVEEAVGRFCGDLLRPEGVDGVRPCEDRCPIVHARFRGTARATENLVLPGGGRRTVIITSSQPAAERQFQVMRDETEVEATRRLRDTVLANISHEFKTPLAAQLASIELLRDRLAEIDSPAGSPAGDAEESEAAGLVGSLERGTLRLTQLIDNLLESVRIESGEAGIRRRPVALDEVVEAAAELMRPLLGQRRQRLEVDLPYPLPPIVGDAPRLTQVFVNLLANANKFAPEGTTIALRGAVEPEGVALWVEDEGPGLPAGSLFERFVRSAGEEPEQSGMGLGLWIVKSIVERHGGRVEAESRRQGSNGSEVVGARVRIVLPRPIEEREVA
jgi:signal transduction histidine kinase